MARKGGGVSAVAALRQRQRHRASKQEGQATPSSIRTTNSQAANILFPRFLDLPMELRIHIYRKIDRVARHQSDY